MSLSINIGDWFGLSCFCCKRSVSAKMYSFACTSTSYLDLLSESCNLLRSSSYALFSTDCRFRSRAFAASLFLRSTIELELFWDDFDLWRPLELGRHSELCVAGAVSELVDDAAELMLEAEDDEQLDVDE